MACDGIQPYGGPVAKHSRQRKRTKAAGIDSSSSSSSHTSCSSSSTSPDGSPYRVFVVEFGSLPEAGLPQFSGRVEHMMSGQNASFTTAEELIEFCARLVNAQISPSRASARRRGSLA